jgi:hypothetical protein
LHLDGCRPFVFSISRSEQENCLQGANILWNVHKLVIVQGYQGRTQEKRK